MNFLKCDNDTSVVNKKELTTKRIICNNVDESQKHILKKRHQAKENTQSIKYHPIDMKFKNRCNHTAGTVVLYIDADKHEDERNS